jgi:hypothetical protein
MTPVLVNGRLLGVQQNGAFTTANTDPIPGGRLWPEAALTWNAMRAAALAEGIAGADFMPAGPNSSARGRAAQLNFWNHRPPPAARPYTSNHGWGIAVDVLGRPARAWIMRRGMKWGWSWDEGRRVGEDWHFRYVGVSKAMRSQLAKQTDPLRVLSKTERRWCVEYDRLKRTNRDRDRRGVLRRAMQRQRKAIWKAAQPRSGGGDGKGWDHAHRRARYKALKARTR